jgi:hypothetical protein
MNRKSDALTVALTGQLPFIIVIAAVLAFVASFLLLLLYRRRVIQSMRRRSSSALLETKGYLPPQPEYKPNDAPLSFHFVDRAQAGTRGEAEKLFLSARRCRWINALVHTLAGACFAATMTAAFFGGRQNGLCAVPLCLFNLDQFLACAYCNRLDHRSITAQQSVRPGRLLCVGCDHRYSRVGQESSATVRSIALSLARPQRHSHPSAADLSQSPHSRRGPLLLVFMIIGIAGATLTTSIVGRNPKLLKAVGEFAFSIGLSATGMMIGLARHRFRWLRHRRLVDFGSAATAL